jgi:hypothetical protein
MRIERSALRDFFPENIPKVSNFRDVLFMGMHQLTQSSQLLAHISQSMLHTRKVIATL